MASNKGLGKGLGALLGESAMQPVNQQSPLLLPLQKMVLLMSDIAVSGD